jgi:hypothetical protein
VQFHRLVLDEAHEMDQFPDRREIYSIKAKNRCDLIYAGVLLIVRYYLSATPFSNLKQVQYCMAFFGLQSEDENNCFISRKRKYDPICTQWYLFIYLFNLFIYFILFSYLFIVLLLLV